MVKPNTFLWILKWMENMREIEAPTPTTQQGGQDCAFDFSWSFPQFIDWASRTWVSKWSVKFIARARFRCVFALKWALPNTWLEYNMRTKTSLIKLLSKSLSTPTHCKSLGIIVYKILEAEKFSRMHQAANQMRSSSKAECAGIGIGLGYLKVTWLGMMRILGWYIVWSFDQVEYA